MNAVLADAGDVRVAMMTGQDRQEEGCEHGPLVRGVVADVMEGTVFNPGIKDATDLQEVDEEGQLP